MTEDGDAIATGKLMKYRGFAPLARLISQRRDSESLIPKDSIAGELQGRNRKQP